MTDSERLATLESLVADLRDDRKTDRVDLDRMLRFQQWLTGAIAAVAFFAGLFSDAIKKKMGL